MRERIKLILKFLALVCGVGLIVFIWKALPVISGYSAKVACSGIFVSGRVQDSVLRNDLASFPLNLSWVSVDYQDSSVTASVLGLARRKAVYRWRLGATLINGMTEEVFREIHMIRPRGVERVADTIDWPQGDRAVAVAEPPQLDAAIGKAFGEGGESPTGTRAVVVVWHGQVVGERYAPGFDKNTRLAGWSMTKSITNALAGILVKEGKLTIDSSAPVREWEGDERRQIKVADLMHMNSGLRWWEFYGGPSDATDMLFKEANMGGYAANSGMKHPPGQVFNYSSGTANILSAIIRKIVGDEYYYRFPYEQLFEKTGMYSAVLEPDASGTFVGSSYCYATARDWARFGLLYLHDGMWNGERILPAGWVKWTTTGSNYGALWWLNKEEVGHRRHPALPVDCYSCEGFEGQYVWVVPSMDLVVVRMACEHGHRLSPDKFLPELIDALKK